MQRVRPGKLSLPHGGNMMRVESAYFSVRGNSSMNYQTPPSSSNAVNDVELKQISEMLSQVAALFKEGQPEKALALLRDTSVDSPWAANALGVCQLRLGNVETAVEIFGGLVLCADRWTLRSDVPAVFKANYASALLAADNISDGFRVLTEIKDEPHGAISRLHAAFDHWRSSLTFFQKIAWTLGMPPARPFKAGFPLGGLE